VHFASDTPDTSTPHWGDIGVNSIISLPSEAFSPSCG
jgi:hypothetical protein